MPFIHFDSEIGIMATEDIAANSTLMEIPLDEVMLFSPTVLISSYPNTVLKSLSEEDRELFAQMDDDLILTAFLMQERMKGESSHWHLWISVLPLRACYVDSSEASHLPLFLLGKGHC